jgi:hypothetical protein
MIYAIIITTDLNKEDENIKEIIERHLRKKIPEIRGICFNCSRDMLQLFQRYASIVPASIVSGKRLERQRETGI